MHRLNMTIVQFLLKSTYVSSHLARSFAHFNDPVVAVTAALSRATRFTAEVYCYPIRGGPVGVLVNPLEGAQVGLVAIVRTGPITPINVGSIKKLSIRYNYSYMIASYVKSYTYPMSLIVQRRPFGQQPQGLYSVQPLSTVIRTVAVQPGPDSITDPRFGPHFLMITGQHPAQPQLLQESANLEMHYSVHETESMQL